MRRRGSTWRGGFRWGDRDAGGSCGAGGVFGECVEWVCYWCAVVGGWGVVCEFAVDGVGFG